MTHPTDHEPDWSNPVDELGGRRACRKCGRIGTPEETQEIRLAELHAKEKLLRKVARRRRRK
ncbi:MAG TPA: hypothetical protein VGG32_05935 [Thermoplasmata archaeon]|jgi:hypothetical protein